MIYLCKLNSIFQCILLFGTSISLIKCSVDYLYQNEVLIKQDNLFLISVTSFVVNLISLYYTHYLHHEKVSGMHQCSHDHGHQNQKCQQHEHKNQDHNHKHNHKHHNHKKHKSKNGCQNKKHFHEHTHNLCHDHDIENNNDKSFDIQSLNTTNDTFSQDQEITLINNHQMHYQQTHDEKNIELKQLDDSFQSSSQEENIKAIIIHLFYDVISSLVVVLSCFMVNFFQIYWFDPLGCFVVSLLLFLNTLPLFKKSFKNIFRNTIDLNGLFKQHPNLFLLNYLNKNSLVINTNKGKILYIKIKKDQNILKNDMNIDEFCKHQKYLKVVIDYY